MSHFDHTNKDTESNQIDLKSPIFQETDKNYQNLGIIAEINKSKNSKMDDYSKENYES